MRPSVAIPRVFFVAFPGLCTILYIMSSTTVTLHEDEDGELYFILPDEVRDRLNWEVGDTLQYVSNNTSVYITKCDDG